MAWFADAEQRAELLVQHGLPVVFTEARIDASGFFALYLRAMRAAVGSCTSPSGIVLITRTVVQSFSATASTASGRPATTSSSWSGWAMGAPL